MNYFLASYKYLIQIMKAFFRWKFWKDCVRPVASSEIVSLATVIRPGLPVRMVYRCCCLRFADSLRNLEISGLCLPVSDRCIPWGVRICIPFETCIYFGGLGFFFCLGLLVFKLQSSKVFSFRTRAYFSFCRVKRWEEESRSIDLFYLMQACRSAFSVRYFLVMASFEGKFPRKTVAVLGLCQPLFFPYVDGFLYTGIFLGLCLISPFVAHGSWSKGTRSTFAS